LEDEVAVVAGSSFTHTPVGSNTIMSSSSSSSSTATAKATEPMLVLDAKEWKTKLITKEDPGHIHKTLGILCLLSFIWRLAHIGVSDMGFQSHPHLTLPTVALHFLLTSSAFVFTIPLRRIKDGTRIWPEYRMHAMVFLCRALVTIGLYWYEEEYNLPRQYDWNFVIVLGSMAAADLCSASVGEHQSNSVRDFDTHPAVKFFFSVMQFFATAGFLMGARRYSPVFLSVAVVQLTPFLGTLRRKNLLGANFGAFLYGVFLVGAYLISTRYSPGATMKWLRITATIAMVAALWRLAPLPKVCRPLQSKYLIWGCLGLLCRHYRPLFIDVWTEAQVMTVFRAILVAVFVMGYFKINYGYNNSKSAQKKVV
jgi:hypothetical protein